MASYQYCRNPRGLPSHKDPSRLMWRVALDLIWHVSFHDALCYTEPRIPLSHWDLERNLSGGVREGTQNKVSAGICVILRKVRGILGRTGQKTRSQNDTSVECNEHKINLDAQIKVVAQLLLKYVTFHLMADTAEVVLLVFLSSWCTKATVCLAEGPARAVGHLAAISLLNRSLIGSLLRLITSTNSLLPTSSVWEPSSVSPRERLAATERQSYTETG